MLNLNNVEKFYPEHLRVPRLKKHLFREYLQYKILNIIFSSKYSDKLSFLGGTALRIVHGNTRFSEDLDFDNFKLSFEEFNDLSEIVRQGLELEGCKVEIRNVSKGAFRCYLRLPDILFENKLTSHLNEKFLIQIDSTGNRFNYEPEKIDLRKFEVFTSINVTPMPLLLSQKICAAFGRKRAKGRDFYDLFFLFSFSIKPNFEYLKQFLDIKNGKELKSFILDNSKNLDFKELANDVVTFLFYEDDKKKVELFVDYVKSLDF